MTGQRAIPQVGPRPCGAKQITGTTPTAVLHPGPRSAQVIYKSSVFMPTNKAKHGKGTEVSRTHTHTHTHTHTNTHTFVAYILCVCVCVCVYG